MAILRQNEDDKTTDDKTNDQKKAATGPRESRESGEPTASRRLATAQNLSASGNDEDYDFTKPHSGEDPKFLGGTVAKVTKDGDVVMSDHLDQGDMLRSAHEDGKKYEGRSTDL